MKRKLLIAAGLLLFGVTAVWQFVLVPRSAERVPPGWRWDAGFTSANAYPDPQTGVMPENDVTGTYTHSITVSPNSRRQGSLELDDRYLIRDVITGTVTWEYNFRAQVDPRTGGHLKEEYRGDYFLFPRNVERKTYNLRFSYLKGIPVAFQQEEEVEGLDTYLFAYRGRGEYTEAYAGTPQYPGTQVQAGQEIKCADDQLVFKVWVEPVTGEMIKIEENCYSNDYVYDIATGEQLQAVDRWAGRTIGDDVIDRAKVVGEQRSKLLWTQRYVPASLLGAGLLCFGLVVLPKKRSKTEDA